MLRFTAVKAMSDNVIPLTSLPDLHCITRHYLLTYLLTDCVGVGVDLIFVIDASGSIGAANFRSVKNFIKSVVGSFDVGPTQTRIGLIKFR